MRRLEIKTHPKSSCLFAQRQLSQRSDQIERLKAPGSPTGAFPDAEFPERRIQVEQFGRLFVFSDGAYEIIRPNGSMLTLEEFINHLAERTRAGTGDLESTLGFLGEARGSGAFEDDLALVEISLDGGSSAS